MTKHSGEKHQYHRAHQFSVTDVGGRVTTYDVALQCLEGHFNTHFHTGGGVPNAAKDPNMLYCTNVTSRKLNTLPLWDWPNQM